jgi:hypothetical protein
MFQVSERENYENRKWLQMLSTKVKLMQNIQLWFKVLGPIQQIRKYQLQLFHTPLTPFKSFVFQNVQQKVWCCLTKPAIFGSQKFKISRCQYWWILASGLHVLWFFKYKQYFSFNRNRFIFLISLQN